MKKEVLYLIVLLGLILVAAVVDSNANGAVAFKNGSLTANYSIGMVEQGYVQSCSVERWLVV